MKLVIDLEKWLGDKSLPIVIEKDNTLNEAKRPYNCTCPTPEMIRKNPGGVWGIACTAHVIC